jgi:flagellar assembly factor FliW
MSIQTASRPMGSPMTDTALDLPIIKMAVPMAGFPAHQDFVLVRLHEEGLLYALTSTKDPEIRFLVAPPEPFFPDYAPELENDVFAALNTKDPDRVLIMVVISAGTKETTANLLAPIVIDRDSQRAIQVILSGSNLPIRAVMNRSF